MSSLEHVALWLGLIVGVISVTLAIVSIVFTFHVDRRSNEISTRTLQSLEEIKNTGKETAAQVTNLVRSVVDRLFGIVEKPPVIQEATSIQQVSSGLAAEVQANIEKELGVDRIPELERVVDDLKISVERLLRDFSFGEDEDAAFEHVTAQLKACSPEAQELVRQLHQRHLTAEEMSMLMHPSKVGGPSNPAAELREQGLLVPLVAEWQEELVYWFPPNVAPLIEAALMSLPEASSSVKEKVSQMLDSIGYGPEEER